jgi:hypothetical protein
MPARNAARTWWPASPRQAVDDAYAAWFSAHARCTSALRAWFSAAPEERAAAYRAYRAELVTEEAAARRLELLNLQAAA